MNVLDRAFEHPQRLEEHAAAPLAGGIMQHGYQCGMIWGATLAAGAEAFRRHGPGPKAEAAAIRAAQRVVESFRARHGEIDCFEITGLDKSSSTWQMISHFFVKGGTIECFRMAAWYAPRAFDEISSTLSDEVVEPPSPPVSCAASLAQKMGESDLHTAMAAGLAGGIGLCGGACGALGAAIWILGMRIRNERGAKAGYKDSRIREAIDRFLKHTNFQFECTGIVGRTFEDVRDHAAYLRDGGCRELLETLAAG
ncbi:MAG: C-GCAxxG-C-C family protein [Acidobacteriota bacterium]